MMEVMLYRWYSNAKLFGRRFIHDEKGEVNIVAIGIAILLAVVFRGKIESLLNTLFGSIEESGKKAIKQPE